MRTKGAGPSYQAKFKEKSVSIDSMIDDTKLIFQLSVKSSLLSPLINNSEPHDNYSIYKRITGNH